MANHANAAEARVRLPELVERAASIGGGRRSRGWMRAPIVISALAVAAIACAPTPAQRFPAKPAGCRLETISTLPQRPFIELETFDLPSSPESMRDILDIVQDRACRDGADAVYAPKGGRTYSYAIALKWNDPPPPPPPAPPPPPPAEPPAPPPPAEPPAA